MFKQVTILGVGLLGASLAMAIRKNKISDNVRLWARNKSTLAKCKNEDWCNETFEDIRLSVRGSELIIVCTPVDSIPKLVDAISDSVEEGALVSDVGSVKNEICINCEHFLRNSKGTFIGSHPMAGSEKSGLENALDNMFEGKNCVITPTISTERKALNKLRDFWISMKMHVLSYSPQEHDKAVAFFSHLPHLVSSTLAKSLSDQPIEWRKVSGNGLRDTTRIAAGDPYLWKQITMMNRENVLDAINSIENNLNLVKEMIKNNDPTGLHSILESGSKFRKSL